MDLEAYAQNTHYTTYFDTANKIWQNKTAIFDNSPPFITYTLAIFQIMGYVSKIIFFS